MTQLYQNYPATSIVLCCGMALDDGLNENGICTFLKVANFNLQSVLDRCKIKCRALHTMQLSQIVFALRKIIRQPRIFKDIKTFTLKLK